MNDMSRDEIVHRRKVLTRLLVALTLFAMAAFFLPFSAYQVYADPPSPSVWAPLACARQINGSWWCVVPVSDTTPAIGQIEVYAPESIPYESNVKRVCHTVGALTNTLMPDWGTRTSVKAPAKGNVYYMDWTTPDAPQQVYVYLEYKDTSKPIKCEIAAADTDGFWSTWRTIECSPSVACIVDQPVFPKHYAFAGIVAASGGLAYLVWRRRSLATSDSSHGC